MSCGSPFHRLQRFRSEPIEIERAQPDHSSEFFDSVPPPRVPHIDQSLAGLARSPPAYAEMRFQVFAHLRLEGRSSQEISRMERVVERAQALRSVEPDARGVGQQFDITRSRAARHTARVEFDLVIEQRRALSQPKQPEDRQRAPELPVLDEPERGHQPTLVERQILEKQPPGFDDRAVSAEAEFGIEVARSPGVKLRAPGLAQKFTVIGLPASQVDGELYFIGHANWRAEGPGLFAGARL